MKEVRDNNFIISYLSFDEDFLGFYYREDFFSVLIIPEVEVRGMEPPHTLNASDNFDILFKIKKLLFNHLPCRTMFYRPNIPSNPSIGLSRI